MGNSSSTDNSSKSNKPIKSSLKSTPKTIVKKEPSQKKQTSLDKYIKSDKEINNIPTYHLAHKEQINSGLNEYQYFNQPIPQEDISNKFGIDTTQDNKYSHNISTLYKREINYRTNVDCSKELPVTHYDLANELQFNDSDNINSKNVNNNNLKNYDYNSNKMNEQPPQNPKENCEDEGLVEITITRDEALKIKECRYLSDLEKRILIMNSIRLQDIDPLHMLSDLKIRLNVLNEKYKSLIRIYHPDKAGSSSNEMFITVKNAFDNQQYVINSKVMDKDYNQLKQDYTEYSQNSKKKKPIFFDSDSSATSFDVNKFNEFYDGHKYNDQYEDDGYGHIMAERGVREDIEIEKIEITKDNTFQDQFNKQLAEKTTEIIKYQVPQAINQNDNYSKLCEKTSNYSSKNSNINCYDYKEAFEIMNIDRNRPERNISLEEYEKSRKEDNLQLSEEQQIEIEKDEEEKDNKEKNRANNMVDYTQSIEKYNNKINKVLLGN